MFSQMSLMAQQGGRKTTASLRSLDILLKKILKSKIKQNQKNHTRVGGKGKIF
jgi:hypothetical protein